MRKDIISGGEALMRSLEYHGVKTIFGYPAGSVMPVLDALYDHRETLNHILVRHEQGAAHAAQRFARASGEVGVCLVTNARRYQYHNRYCGCNDRQYTDCSHCRTGGNSFFGDRCFSGGRLGRHHAANYKMELSDPSCRRCAMGGGPRLLYSEKRTPGTGSARLCKKCPGGESRIYACETRFQNRSYVPVPETHPEAVKAAAELINGAERPLVLVGQGVELGNAQQELRAFIEKADMPAGCTLLGLSALPTEHPLNKGMLGNAR